MVCETFQDENKKEDSIKCMMRIVLGKSPYTGKIKLIIERLNVHETIAKKIQFLESMKGTYKNKKQNIAKWEGC